MKKGVECHFYFVGCKEHNHSLEGAVAQRDNPVIVRFVFCTLHIVVGGVSVLRAVQDQFRNKEFAGLHRKAFLYSLLNLSTIKCLNVVINRNKSTHASHLLSSITPILH